LLDPEVNELGQRFNKQKLQNRDQGKDLFVKRVNEISDYAKQKGIKILLENNVMSASNHDSFGENPFLMTHHHEIIEIMKATDENVGLLVDLAHLKVSANVEKFCKFEFLEVTTEYTQAYHLSDNNGLADTNDPVSSNSWFWPYINKNLNYYTLEVYNQSFDIIKDQLRITQSALMN
jgi:sugar phosphate isomerase/epimerase